EHPPPDGDLRPRPHRKGFAPMSSHGSPTTRRFVRAAWMLLLFQLLAAIGTVAVAAWAFFAVRDLANERSMLQARVTELESAQKQPAPPPAPAEPAGEVMEAPAAPPSEPDATREPRPEPSTRQPQARRPPVSRPPAPLPVYTPPTVTPPPYVPP